MFSVYPFSLVMIEKIYTLSYYHHQIGSMIYYPLFRVRSWNNGMRCMFLYILILIETEMPFWRHFPIIICTGSRLVRKLYHWCHWVTTLTTIYLKTCAVLLSHWGHVTHTCIGVLNNYCFRQWLAAYSAPHVHVNHWWRFPQDTSYSNI